MSFVQTKEYSEFDKKITPYNFFNSLMKPSYEPVVKDIRRPDGSELKTFMQPEALDNNKLLNNNNIKTNAEYRKYLTSKATIIMDHNSRTYEK